VRKERHLGVCLHRELDGSSRCFKSLRMLPNKCMDFMSQVVELITLNQVNES